MISLNLFNKIFFVLFFLSFSMKGYFLNAQENQMESTESNNVEETLIDFTEFEDRIQSSGLFPNTDPLEGKKAIDLTREDLDPSTLQPKYMIKSDDMLYKNWIVQFNSSAKTVKTRSFSYAKKVVVKKPYAAMQTEAGKEEKGKGQSVLGVRVHFPETPFHAYAEIMPRFEIPSYTNEGKIISQDPKGKYLGVIHNVGLIKKISVDISGRNFKNGIAIRLKDNMGVIREYFLGYSYFPNWRRLIWRNPAYLSSIDFDNLYRVPLYPVEVPFVKFNSIVIYRPSGELGGDTITYFRKIDLWFDYAVNPNLIDALDIDDESNWGILEKRAKDTQEKYLRQNADRIEMLRNRISQKGNNLEEKDLLENKNNNNAQQQQQQQQPAAAAAPATPQP